MINYIILLKGMNMALISIIVPIHQVEQYLPPCIDSILAQTYQDFELILVDDGSPDNCGAICDAYAQKDGRIRVIHQEYQGVAAARNTGIDAAQGKYLAFVDSDDIVHREYLSKLYYSITSNNADASICGMISFCGDVPEMNTTDGGSSVTVMSGREACLGIYNMDNQIPVMLWGKLYKRRLFRGIRCPAGLIHEDDATTPKLLYSANRVVQISDKLYLYRSRPGSIMRRRFTAKRFDCIEGVRSCINFYELNHDSEAVKIALEAMTVMQAKTVVLAYSSNAKDQIPERYRMGKWKALKIIYQNASHEKFSWYLSLVHPKLVRPHSYWVKIRQILGMDNKS